MGTVDRQSRVGPDGAGPTRRGDPEGTKPEPTAPRYRPLVSRAHGLDQEAVAADQRERLQSAMMELTVRRGYHDTRIGDLTALAHVSRPTFYRLYRDKEDCYLAAYRDAAGRFVDAVLTAYSDGGDEHQRARAAIETFLRLATEQAHVGAFITLAVINSGPPLVEAFNRRMIERLHIELAAGAHSGIPLRVAFGGVRQVASRRLREGVAQELTGLADELAEWVLAYRSAALRGAAPSSSEGHAAVVSGGESDPARVRGGRLPSGRHRLSRDLVASNQQQRILDAVADLVVDRGYGGLTVTEVSRIAQISHRTFYEHYSDKRAAFIAAARRGSRRAFDGALTAYRSHPHGWPAAICAAVSAYIRLLASEPSYAQLAFIEMPKLGPHGLAYVDEAMDTLAAYLGAGQGAAGGPVGACALEATAGALWQLIHDQLSTGRTEQLPALAPQLAHVALTPFLGVEEAARIVASEMPVGEGGPASSDGG